MQIILHSMYENEKMQMAAKTTNDKFRIITQCNARSLQLIS